MFKDIFSLLKRYKSIIFYLAFGGGTTIVNIIIFYICAHIIHVQTIGSTCIAWIFAVLFAYITNKIWVFESETNQVVKEFFSFLSCRFVTGIIDLVIMYIFVNIIGMNDVLVKVVSNILVIVLNYIASKFVIFNEK